MTQSKKPYQLRKKYKSNPFMQEIKTIHKRITNRQGDMVLINKSGEVKSEIAGFWQSKEVDASQFVKLFANGVKALTGISTTGTKVFEVFCLEVQKNISTDMITLAFPFVDQRITPMSKRTFERGLRELMDRKFIAATKVQALYWINPEYVFNGDKLAFVQSYTLKKTKEAIQDVNSLLDKQEEMKALEAAGQQKMEI